MPLPATFLTHLETAGYHSRSDKHSKAVCEAIVIDLMTHCPKIAAEAAARQLVFDYNVELVYGRSRWNTDLSIGPPPPGAPTTATTAVAGMLRGTPAWTRIAVEAKAVMTKHTGARKNRKRDLEAHHQHVHEYDSKAIAASITLVNAAATFYSPVPPAGMRIHKNPLRLAQLVVDEVENVTMSSGSSTVGLDAKCALVVDMSNVVQATGDYDVRYLTKPPGPKVGTPIHWDSFIQRICAVYGARY